MRACGRLSSVIQRSFRPLLLRVAIASLICAFVAYNIYIRRHYKVWDGLRSMFWNGGLTVASVVLIIGFGWLGVVCALSVVRERRLRRTALEQASRSTAALSAAGSIGCGMTREQPPK